MRDALTTFVQPWADVYAESSWVPTAVIAVHVLAMFVAGGIALGADRRVLQVASDSTAGLLAVVNDLRGTHRVVIAALVVTVLSGVALFTSDLGTFWDSRVFWLKMGTLLLLLFNGLRMRRSETRFLSAAGEHGEPVTGGSVMSTSWRSLQSHAWVSFAGWLMVVLLGAIVANI